ncbi:GNAT family N-acetyltransferase [Crassaminicella thermophila]|uniref:GNAT family N-acetyltransferase n=1 Tax=Crassaminicella thermophila TaxID=2599308 RepID=A0A5C0SC87_CRATE|nr:GNAT family N-acetyltransferase [Crassaminicella thermophila]QEK11316.1 GNAT family N-acetyltransferase [Crassaminicella thermophila]
MALVMGEYKKDDEQYILELFKDVFKREMTNDYWSWRYDKALINEKYIKLMWEDNLLVGHYAVFPILLKIGKKYVKTGFSMTTMTARQYKGQGIFKTLAQSLYLENYNNLKIIWGFPNDNSLYGFKKYLGWIHISDINMMAINLYNIQNIEPKINICYTSRFTDEYNRLFQTISEKYDIIVNRNSEYLKWRYVDNPQNQYYIMEYRQQHKLLGYCIYKLFNNGKLSGDIVDILAIDRYVFKELIINVLYELKNKGAISANIWMNDIEFVEELFKIGFIQTNEVTHIGCKINSNNLEENILNFSKWYLTMGDSDVF